MYLHLGNGISVPADDLIGIFDLENASLSKFTREFLSRCTHAEEVYNVSFEMPKSFVVCEDPKTKKRTVYISQISSRTLWKRANLRQNGKNR